ncbi:hypothetical protein COO60DRAFT_501050 [Scenedesmus sp. NREL 46B-D3]|nr:hypothetical protein COO60DRAFT_501050 [Scenedesmus sp. NREL 46B-D3]
MAKLLPDLPELRPQLQALLGPQVAALDAIVSQASRQAVDAAAAASQGALLGLGTAMTGITGLLKDAQFQLAGLLGAAAQAGKSLNATLAGPSGNNTKPPQLAMLDRNLLELGNNIARDVNNTLTALRPPIQILEGIVRPLAIALNTTLGGFTALLTGTPVSAGLTGVLQLLLGFATSIIQGVAAALQLPLPQLPPIPALGGGTTNSPSPAASPGQSPSPSSSPSPSASFEELLSLVNANIRPTLNALGVSNATIDRVVNSTASALLNLGASNATFVTAVSQLPLAELGFGNLSNASIAAVQQQLQPLVNNIQARFAAGANMRRGLLQDESAAGDESAADYELAAADDSAGAATLEEYVTLVDASIRPTLESLGTDNATIVQLVNSTAAFLFSLEVFPGDVNFAMRAAQELQALSPAALSAIQQRLQPIIDDIQARTNGKSDGQPKKPEKPGKPGKPEKPDKPSKDDKPEKPEKPSKGNKPEKPEKPGKDDKPEKPDKPSKGDDKPGKPGSDDKKDDDKPEKPQEDDGAAKPPAPQLPPLPNFSSLFSVGNLQGLQNGDGSAFNPAAFLQQVGSELQKALDRFAQQFTGTLLGAPGVSGSDGAQQVLQGLGNTIQTAVSAIERSIASLPRGPVFEFLMGQGVGVTFENSDAAMRTLQRLQQQLVSTLDGAGDGLNVTSPEELAQLVRSAGSALQSLAGGDGQFGQLLSGQAMNSGVLAQSGQLVSQLARTLTPVSEAAGQMLQGFRENLSQLVMPLLGGL